MFLKTLLVFSLATLNSVFAGSSKQKRFKTLYTRSGDMQILKTIPSVVSELNCMSICVLEDDQCPAYHYDNALKSCDFLDFDSTGNPDPVITSALTGYKVVADVAAPMPQKCKFIFKDKAF